MQERVLAGRVRLCPAVSRSTPAPVAKRDGLPIRKPADSVFCSLLKILYGLLIVRSPLKVHRKFRCNFSGAFAIERLRLFPYSPVQLNPPGCGHPFVEHVLIQSVNETVPRYGFSFGSS